MPGIVHNVLCEHRAGMRWPSVPGRKCTVLYRMFYMNPGKREGGLAWCARYSTVRNVLCEPRAGRGGLVSQVVIQYCTECTL